MKKITFKRDYFYANYFWSVSDGYEIPEDILVKTYLTNYFTFGDIVSLYYLVGKDKLLKYAHELYLEDRIKKLICRIEIVELEIDEISC